MRMASAAAPPSMSEAGARASARWAVTARSDLQNLPLDTSTFLDVETCWSKVARKADSRDPDLIVDSIPGRAHRGSRLGTVRRGVIHVRRNQWRQSDRTHGQRPDVHCRDARWMAHRPESVGGKVAGWM